MRAQEITHSISQLERANCQGLIRYNQWARVQSINHIRGSFLIIKHDSAFRIAELVIDKNYD